ncbi:pseudaminic acid cytidylyltransferase [Sphingopyxis sp.]|uniref:pseudaminic acid cytidylyltransferase n=1 Tax=Sphingopyxis sp. TaxID=1908224 RepID=UPI002ED788A1
MKLAVIPARGGSKRIPRKNIRPFHGKPIIGWSIEAALASGRFDRVIVSTDDAEIAEVAKGFGAEVPFMRPADLSNDVAPTGVVVQHAVQWHQQSGMAIDHCCCLYATAPFVTPELIADGFDRLVGSEADFAVSVTSFPFPIQRACRIRDGRLQMIDPSAYLTRSQDLDERFHDAGQFYWGRAQAWTELRPILGEATLPVIVPRHRVQDIDTQEDWERAELLFGALARQEM